MSLSPVARYHLPIYWQLGFGRTACLSLAQGPTNLEAGDRKLIVDRQASLVRLATSGPRHTSYAAKVCHCLEKFEK